MFLIMGKHSVDERPRGPSISKERSVPNPELHSLSVDNRDRIDSQLLLLCVFISLSLSLRVCCYRE